MASRPELNPQIVTYLNKKLNKSVGTIRSGISRLRRKYPHATLNAVAQVYAELHKESVRRLLTRKDRLTIPSVKIEFPSVLQGRAKPKQDRKTIVQFHTDDHFLKKHIDEINRAYNRQCYTCVFVLTRKVLENLIIHILKNKYPVDRDLYFDRRRGRYHDFSVVLDNLFKKRIEFDDDKKNAIDRLAQKLKPFKKDANDKVHSLFHIVEGPREVDDWNLHTIMALITTINQVD